MYAKFCLVGVAVVGLGGIAIGYTKTQQTLHKQRQSVPATAQKLTRIIAIGDTACESTRQKTTAECHFDEVAAAVRKQNPDKVLLLGDLQYQVGAAEEFTKSFGTIWGELKQKSLSVPGNHEYQTKNAKGYFDYWNGDKQTSNQAGDRAKGYFAKTVASWKIIGLNSNCEYVACDQDSEQGKWLKNELSNQTTCTIAMWHHPRFTSGKYATDDASKDRSKYFWEALAGAKTDIILNGHDHIYERFARQRPDQTQDVNGAREFIVGTGGRSHYEQKPKAKNQEKIINDTFGFLQLDLVNYGYQWKFIDTKGTVLDAGSNLCSK